MKENSFSNKFYLSFAIGVIVSFTNILAPVHELGHVVFGTGATITGWASTNLAKPTWIGFMGGLLYELIVYTIMMTLFHQYALKNLTDWPDLFAAFPWGIINGNLLSGCYSSDIVLSIPTTFGVTPAYPIISWIIFCTPVLVAGWLTWPKILKKKG